MSLVRKTAGDYQCRGTYASMVPLGASPNVPCESRQVSTVLDTNTVARRA